MADNPILISACSIKALTKKKNTEAFCVELHQILHSAVLVNQPHKTISLLVWGCNMICYTEMNKLDLWVGLAGTRRGSCPRCKELTQGGTPILKKVLTVGGGAQFQILSFGTGWPCPGTGMIGQLMGLFTLALVSEEQYYFGLFFREAGSEVLHFNPLSPAFLGCLHCKAIRVQHWMCTAPAAKGGSNQGGL